MRHWSLLLAAASAMVIGMHAAPAWADLSIEYNSDFGPLVEPGVADFEKATGQKVTLVKLPSDGYVERTSLDLSSGSAADLVMADSFVVAELAASGYLLPLDDMLKNWDQFKYYQKGLLDVASYNGHVYGLPTDTDVRMLWYNKDVFAKAGIAVPWTPKSWQDVLDTARTIKQKTGLDDAFILPAGTKLDEATTMQGFYMALLGADTPDGDHNRLRDRKTGKWIGDSPAIRRTLQLYQDIYVNKKLGTSALNYSADPNAANAAFISDKIGILASGSWEESCLWGCDNKNPPSQADKDKIAAWTPFPGSGQPGAKATTNISGGWTITINAHTPDPQDAFKLLTTIFGYKNFEKWTVDNGRMAVRSDIANSPQYQANTYLAAATKLAADTTGRDTVPGYDKVSSLVQQMTDSILNGKSVDDTVKEYHDALVDDFGDDQVEVIK